MAWTTQKSQAFTNSNGTLLTAHDSDFSYWSVEPQIQSNALRGSGGYTTSYFRLTGVTLADDQAVEYKLATADSSRFHAPLVRIGTIGTGGNFDAYQVFCQSTSTHLRRVDYDAGGTPSYTSIDLDSGLVIAAGDTIRLEAVGTGLEVFKNGASVLSGTDATHSSGDAGGELYFGFGFSCTIDDLVIEDDAGGGGTPVSGTPLLSARLRRTATLLRM